MTMASNAVSQDQAPPCRSGSECFPWARVELVGPAGSRSWWTRRPFRPWWRISAPGEWIWSLITSTNPCRGSGPRRRAGSRTWRPGRTASGPGWIGPNQPGITWRRRSIATSPRCCELDPETRKPMALMHVGLTNVPAIKHLPPLVAKWGGKPPPGESRGRRTGGQGSGGENGPGKEKGKMVEKLKRLMGLRPEVEEGAVCGKALEAFRDLAATLNLPGEASVAQLKGAVEALKAGAARLVKTEEELAGPQSPPGGGDGRPGGGRSPEGRQGQPGPKRLGPGILSPGPGRLSDLCGPGPETGAHRERNCSSSGRTTRTREVCSRRNWPFADP